MSDLTKRLKALSKFKYAMLIDFSIGDEAADEIERLTAELAKAIKSQDKWNVEEHGTGPFSESWKVVEALEFAADLATSRACRHPHEVRMAVNKALPIAKEQAEMSEGLKWVLREWASKVEIADMLSWPDCPPIIRKLLDTHKETSDE